MSDEKLNANERLIEKAAQQIRGADALLICAGAGMGVDSGMPDFRGNEGFWKAYPPFAKLGYNFMDLANPEWFERDPGLAWGFYGHRLNLYRATVPHPGFNLLLQWGKQKSGGYFVFTSNVDGHFQKSGFAEECISECHGSIHHMQCAHICTEEIWPAGNVRVEVDETTMRAGGSLPKCPNCGGIARPNILMFGDWGWISHRSNLQHRYLNDWLIKNRHAATVIIECGAGIGVPTVRLTSENIVARFNAHLIRINIREPQTPPGQTGIPSGALETLRAIQQLL